MEDLAEKEAVLAANPKALFTIPHFDGYAAVLVHLRSIAKRPLREGVRTLHQRGFRVVIKGWGVIDHTWPAAGEHAAAGATITVFAQAEPSLSSK